MSALSFKINAETDKLNSFIASLERLEKVLQGIPSNTKEFDVINRKISEMEARAEQSIRKIAQMQADAAQTVGQTASKTIAMPSDAGYKTGAQAVNRETEAWRDLLQELHLVSAQRDENIRLIHSLQTTNAGLKKSIEGINKAERDGIVLSERKIAARAKYSLSLEENKIAISRYRQELANQIKLEQSARGSINEMAQALGRMRAVYRTLNESERGSDWGKNLLGQIEGLDAKVKSLDASMGVHARNVENYASGFNMLGFQIQQVARELPSIAYGPQVFFAAISNNLPMLVDEVARARVEYNKLIEAGQKATPVWKQMLSSIFSWQTLLVAGLTVFTLYGKEITQWVVSLFKGKKALDSAKEAAKQFNEVMSRGAMDAQQEVTKLDLLYNAATDLSKSYEERKIAVDKLKRAYPAYFGDMSNELIMTGRLSGKYEELKTSLLEAARARAAFDRMVDINKPKAAAESSIEYELHGAYEKRIVDLQKRQNKLIEKRKRLAANGINTLGVIVDINTLGVQMQNLREAQEKVFKDWLKYAGDEFKWVEEKGIKTFTQLDDYINSTSQKLAGKASETATTLTTEEQNKIAEEKRKAAEAAAERYRSQVQKDREDLAAALEKLSLEAQQAEIDAMVEGTSKKIAQTKLDYKKRMAVIKEEEEKIKELQGGKLTAEQQSQFALRRQSALSSFMWDTSNTIGKKLNEDRDAWNKYYIEYGTFREQLQATKDKYDRLLAEAGTEGEKAQIAAERDEALALIEARSSEWAQKLTELTISELEKRITETQKLLEEAENAYRALESSNTPQAKEFLRTIIMLKAQLSVMQDKAGKAKKAVADKDWKEGASLLNEISSTAREAASSLGEFDEALGKVATFIANMASAAGNLITTIDGVKAAAETAGRSLSAMEKATIILAAISAAFQVMQGLFSLFSGGESAVEKTRREFAELNEEIVRLKRESELDNWKGTIFGADDYRKASEGMQVYLKAMGRYNDTLERIRKRPSDMPFFNIADYRKTWETAAKSIANMQVQTRHSTWFRSAKYQSLGSLLPGIFNEDGSINMEALKEFQGSDLFKKINGENRKLINDLIADWELYEKALDEVKGYLSGIFGDLGNTMTDALVEAFANGTDAAQSFADSVSEVLENLAKDMVQSVYLTPIFEKAQEELLKVMGADNLTEEQKFARYTEIMKRIVGNAVSAQEDAMKMLEAFQDAAKENGLDIFKPENDALAQSATSRGIQAMSQDVGSELNGRFTDIQGKVTDIRGFVMNETGQIIAILTACQHIESIQVDAVQVGHELLRYAVMIYMEIVEINSTTKNMYKVLVSMNDRLDKIERNTSGI